MPSSPAVMVILLSERYMVPTGILIIIHLDGIFICVNGLVRTSDIEFVIDVEGISSAVIL